jgi:hypothetical protein
MTLQLLLSRGRGVSAEPTAAELLQVTEEEARYLSHTGVCAGTPQMIERTVDAFVSGIGISPAAIPESARALDYGVATAALLLVAAAREARTRLLVIEAGLDSESIARELADVGQREGDAAVILQGTTELAAAMLGSAIDPAAVPLVAAEQLPHPEAQLLFAILGIEVEVVRLAAHHQALANDALGVTATPVLKRRDIALGLAPTPRRLWGDRVAAHLGWIVEEDDDGLALRMEERRVRLYSPGTCSAHDTRGFRITAAHRRPRMARLLKR